MNIREEDWPIFDSLASHVLTDELLKDYNLYKDSDEYEVACDLIADAVSESDVQLSNEQRDVLSRYTKRL